MQPTPRPLPSLQSGSESPFFVSLKEPANYILREQKIVPILYVPAPIPESPASWRRSEEELQPAAVLADLAHLADGTHGALVLAVVLGPVERALLVRRAAVDGRVAGRADFELGELVKLDFNLVVRVPLS